MIRVLVEGQLKNNRRTYNAGSHLDHFEPRAPTTSPQTGVEVSIDVDFVTEKWSPKARAVVYYRVHKELTWEETAERAGVSRSTVGRVMARLRKEMRDGGYV